MDKPSADRPLYQQEPLNRFSDRADDYARFRPTYPIAAIAAMLENLGNPADLVAVDLGGWNWHFIPPAGRSGGTGEGDRAE